MLNASQAIISNNVIINEGFGAITNKGVCWNTTGNPDLSDFTATAGVGAGSYTVTMTGLKPGTTYYYRAFAVNDYGQGFGEEFTLTTPPVYNATRQTVFTSIQASIADIGTLPGDLIEIPEGTHTENVNDFKGLNFSPGSSPGCVIIHGSFTATPTTTFTIEIEGEDTGLCEYDRFVINGTFFINNSSLEISLGSYNPPVGSVYPVFSFNNRVGDFSTPLLIQQNGSFFLLEYKEQLINLNAIRQLFRMELKGGH
jgi:hypothetical protein